MGELSDEVLLVGVLLVAWLSALLGFFLGVMLSVIGRWEREDETQQAGDAGLTLDEKARRR